VIKIKKNGIKFAFRIRKKMVKIIRKKVDDITHIRNNRHTY